MVRIAQGDRRAFEALVQRYRPRLERFAARILDDPEAARDAAQETLLRLWQKAGLYHDQGCPDAFIYSVARNVCLREREGAARRQAEPLSHGGDLRCSEGTAPGLAQAVADAVRALPAEQRLVFILSEYEGLNYEQIGQAMGCPRGTVASRKHAAVRSLARLLLPDGRC